MEAHRKRLWIPILIALTAAACAVFLRTSQAGAEQETFTNQCPGGTIEVWPTYTGMGLDSYFQGQRQVTAEFSFPEASVEQTVVVTLVAISTGTNCREVEVRTRTMRAGGGGSDPPVPDFDFNLPSGEASFGGYDSFGDFELSRGKITARGQSGERYVVQTSNRETVVGGPDQALELVSPEGTTCHNGHFYYGMNANGNTWSSGCVTAEEAASYGWDQNHISSTPPDHDEVYDELSSGRSGWRYEQWRGGEKVGTIACTLRRLSLGSEYREFACTMP